MGRREECEGNNGACLELTFHRWWYAYSIVNSGKIKNSTIYRWKFLLSTLRLSGLNTRIELSGKSSTPTHTGKYLSHWFQANAEKNIPICIKRTHPYPCFIWNESYRFFDIMNFQPVNRGHQRGCKVISLSILFFFFDHIFT